MTVIAVLAAEHPERDEWVDEQAATEAYNHGRALGEYHGVHELPTGALVHVFASADEAEEWLRGLSEGSA